MSLFDLDTTEITGDELRRMRKTLDKHDHERTGRANEAVYPSQCDMGARLGVSGGAWRRWERRGATATTAALLRIWQEEGCRDGLFSDARVSGTQVKRLVAFAGEASDSESADEAVECVADELGVSTSTVRRWMTRGSRAVSAKLVLYLLDTFGLSDKGAA